MEWLTSIKYKLRTLRYAMLQEVITAICDSNKDLRTGTIKQLVGDLDICLHQLVRQINHFKNLLLWLGGFSIKHLVSNIAD